MNEIFTEERYNEMIEELFLRFPSFQKVGAGAYKPGIDDMMFADQLMGHPHRSYKIIHVAGTNGKGSVSNMLASVLSALGMKVGLYTSPHIMDFRERIRMVEPSLTAMHPDGKGVLSDSSFRLIAKQDVWDFISGWKDTFDHLDMSFFEITTLMALDWFAIQNADVVVLETGLGGRLDSTNIVKPILSVITNIGLDHCDMLGESLAEIAFEKAGIIKPCVPVAVGESNIETDPVFERKVLYTNLPEPEYMGNREAIMSLLTFADKTLPPLWDCHQTILEHMDLQGDYQSRNLRTVLTVLDLIRTRHLLPVASDMDLEDVQSPVVNALVHAAKITGFRGRWEKLSDSPYVICDIGHNCHGLRYNFSQLARMKEKGECTDLIIVYGSVADKDVDSVIHLMPEDATYIFTQAKGRRALSAEDIRNRYLSVAADSCNVYAVPDVEDAVILAKNLAADIVRNAPASIPLIYIGGSTYVVSEAAGSF